MKRSVVDDIVQPLTSALGNDKTRISLALAVAIAYSLPMPAQSVEGGKAELYYIRHCMTKVNRFVSDFNERFLVDVSGIADAVKTIWCVRYDMLYSRDPAKLIAIAQGTCPIKDYLAGFSFDDVTASQVISAGIASIDRIERELCDESSTTSDV
ncbi:hypothetical protein SPLA10_PHROGS00023 [Salmonella phage SPLA10]|nr:hypothetical protein SPLA10_PHROGS00023 [Salmonella phage SPLA10]